MIDLIKPYIIGQYEDERNSFIIRIRLDDKCRFENDLV